MEDSDEVLGKKEIRLEDKVVLLCGWIDLLKEKWEPKEIL
jgi:hypothetical protein